MSRSKHQYHPDWRNKKNRKTLKYKNFKMRPYGMCPFCNYGNEFYKGEEEREYTLTKKGKERKRNKINILDIEE